MLSVYFYALLFRDSKSLLMKVIICIIFVPILLFLSMHINAIISGPLLCDHVGDLQDGTIARTPLLQQGQTIKTLAHGTYNVTGGIVEIGRLGNGHVTKVIGIAAQGIPANTLTYTPNTQPFNENFASILFELRAAGQSKVSHSALDYAYANRQLITPSGNFNAMHLQSYRVFAGMPMAQFGETSISNSVINGIAS